MQPANGQPSGLDGMQRDRFAHAPRRLRPLSKHVLRINSSPNAPTEADASGKEADSHEPQTRSAHEHHDVSVPTQAKLAGQNQLARHFADSRQPRVQDNPARRASGTKNIARPKACPHQMSSLGSLLSHEATSHCSARAALASTNHTPKLATL